MPLFVPKKTTGFQGTPPVQGDKSISHRALILGSVFPGVTKIIGLNEGQDVMCTQQALEMLGVRIHRDGHIRTLIAPDTLKPKSHVFWMGNSGTTTRLMMGVFAAIPKTLYLDGDVSLRKRPMGRVIQPLSDMGAVIQSRSDCLPLAITGTCNLASMTYQIPVPSAQVKSAILLAGLFSKHTTTVIETIPTRAHTEYMLQELGYSIDIKDTIIRLVGQKHLQRDRIIHVQKDPSGAAFWVVGALITPMSEITLDHICMDPFRLKYIDILIQMGGNIRIMNNQIVVKSSNLHGIHVTDHYASHLIDEYPILFIAASLAKGLSQFDGLHELRTKESNRLEGMMERLKRFGINTWIHNDSLFIQGQSGRFDRPDITIDADHDHRIAMSFAILASGTTGCHIKNHDTVSTSFPNFWSYLLYESRGVL